MSRFLDNLKRIKDTNSLSTSIVLNNREWSINIENIIHKTIFVKVLTFDCKIWMLYKKDKMRNTEIT